jgi:hypothetical protein
MARSSVRFFARHKKTLGVLLFLTFYSVGISFATPPTSTYQPGATLDPNCAPGSTNCTVSLIPDQAGSSGKYLTTDGTTTSWATVSAGVSGSGTTNYLTKWTASGTVGDSVIQDDGTNVGIGTASPQVKLHISGAGSSTFLRVENTSSTGAARLQLFSDASNTIVTGQVGVLGTGASGGNLALIPSSMNVVAAQSGGLLIGTSASTPIRFFTGSTALSSERMRIDATGNVGIGTVTPGAKLEVRNDTASSYITSSALLASPVGVNMLINNQSGIGGSTSLMQFQVTDADTTNSMWYTGVVSGASYGGPFVIGNRTGATAYEERIRIASSGNVAIGPLYADASSGLQIYSTSGATLGLTTNSTGATSSDGLRFQMSGSNASITNNENGNLVFGTDGNQRLAISGTGVITIWAAPATATTTYDLLTFNYSTGVVERTPITSFAAGSGTTNYVTRWTGTNTVGTGVIYDDGSKVGIATGTPTTLFDVRGTTDQYSGQITTGGNFRQVRSQASLASFSGFNLGFISFAGTYNSFTSVLEGANIGAMNDAAWTSTSSPASLIFRTTASGSIAATEQMRISGSGNVSIGNTNNTYKLEVGSASISGIVARFTNSTGTCDINPTSSSLSCSSDERLKKNITNLDDTILDRVLALRPVTYNWNGETDDQSQHNGFIAQEVEELFPDLVSTDARTDLKSLNYIGLIPYTIKAVQEMNITITSLENLDEPNTLRNSLIAWMGDIENGIQSLFSKKIITEQLCVRDDSGETCLTRSQVDSILNGNSSSSVEESAPLVPEEEPVIIEENPTEEPPVESTEPAPEAALE